MSFRLKVHATRTSSMQADSYTTSGKYVCLYISVCDYLFNPYAFRDHQFTLYITFPAGYFSFLDCYRRIHSYWSCFAYCFTRCTLECNILNLIFAVYNSIQICIILYADFEFVIVVSISGC